ncbi:hypothetical protein [Cryobacterium sp. M91]|uniref:hypothetical protein n=1 Tax=Cryobacterium sp. M91 TaxID=2048294 RepID=UPI000CE4046D|nr:hypothetical protein [Cryobacterium sp. M91]
MTGKFLPARAPSQLLEKFHGKGPARATSVLAALGLTYIMLRPVSNNLVLYSVFTIIGFLAVASLMRGRKIAPELIAIALAIAILAAYGIAIGGSNPGLPYTLLIWVLAPGLLLACAAAATPFALEVLFWGAAVATVLVSMTLILFVYGESGAIPQLVPPWLEEQTGLGATFFFDGTQARSFGLSSLTALGPLWVASLLVQRPPLLPPWPIRLFCAGIALAAAMVSSRSAIMIVMVLTPLIVLMVHVYLRAGPRVSATVRPRTAAIALFSGAILVGAIAVFAPAIDFFAPLKTTLRSISSFFTGTSASLNADESIRTDEASQLTQAWTVSPIFGSGFGTQIPGYARTSERPWVLELQYHLLAFNVGLVGLLLLVMTLAVGFLLIRRSVAHSLRFKPTVIVFLSTSIAMLVGNATNPYLQAPGHMWAIFLPLAAASAFLNQESSHVQRASDA